MAQQQRQSRASAESSQEKGLPVKLATNSSVGAVFGGVLTASHDWGLPGWLHTTSDADIDIEAYRAKVAELESEEDETAGSSDDNSQILNQRKRRKKQEHDLRTYNKLLNRPFLPDPGPPHENDPDWAGAYGLFKQGLANSKLLRDRTSYMAYTEAVPELEDNALTTQRPEFNLHPHQREALGWWRNISRQYGCFMFSDDTGLGKTAVSVARIKLAILESTNGGARKRFLIIVPPSLITLWKQELGRCPSIKFCVYHTGKERSYNKAQLEHFDVVLSTYDVLTSEYTTLKSIQRDFTDTQNGYQYLIERKLRQANERRSSHQKPLPEKLLDRRANAPLLGVEWYEVIVDEAHIIKGKDDLRGLALCQLKASSRVCITSTPFQDDLWNYFTMLRFMRLSPFNREKFFQSCFIKSSEERGADGKRIHEVIKLCLAAVLAAVQLRRLNQDDFDGRPLIGAAFPHHIYHLITLCEEVQQTQSATSALWDGLQPIKKLRAVSDVHEPTLYFTTEEDVSIYEARVSCIHPDLLKARYGDSGQTELEGRLKTRHDVELEAFPTVDESKLTSEYSQTEQQRKQWQTNRQAFMNYIRSKPYGWESDKTIPILATIRQIVDAGKQHANNLPTATARNSFLARNKIIVFCEFLAALDILEIAIQKEFGVNPLRLDGQSSVQQRQQICDQFEEAGKDFSNPMVQPDERTILLATTTVASDGLTLVHAQHVMHVAPSWSPFVEDKCDSLAIRVGQMGQVTIHSFVMARSVEERIVEVGAAHRATVSSARDSRKLARMLPSMDRWDQEYFQHVLE